jgi:hypothetical protein
MIYHDESIFNTNKGQTWMWGEEERPAFLPKTNGEWDYGIRLRGGA